MEAPSTKGDTVAPYALRPALALIVAIALSASCGAISEAERHAQDGRAAVAAGDWAQAFTNYRAAWEENPTLEETRIGLYAAVNELVAQVPGLAVETEVALLRWLEQHGRWDQLRAVLDASVVEVPASTAMMGTAGGRLNEQPARQVDLDTFTIDRYEVTNLQYAAFAESTGELPPVYWSDGTFPVGTATHPVVGVSWRQADTFCAAAGKRLPTEAEWERACSGLDALTYPWGNEWNPAHLNVTLHPLASPDDAWPWLTGQLGAPASLGRVGEPLAGASPFGVCNLAGNASEWVADWYDLNAYAVLGDVNPIGDGPPWNRSVRGGSWLFRHDDPELLIEQGRCAFRNSSHSADDPRVGFRCAADSE